MEKLYDVVVDFTCQWCIYSHRSLWIVFDCSPLKGSMQLMNQLEEDMGFSEDNEIFNVSSKEHAAQHKITLQWVGVHTREHDQLWDVILNLMEHIDNLEASREGF
jgi:hypothetical protein